MTLNNINEAPIADLNASQSVSTVHKNKMLLLEFLESLSVSAKNIVYNLLFRLLMEYLYNLRQ